METNPILKALYHITHLLDEIRAELKVRPDSAVRNHTPNYAEEEMTRQQVMEYLGICNTTYKRRVKDGTLKPRKLPGGHRFYKSDLHEAYKESVRKGLV